MRRKHLGWQAHKTSFITELDTVFQIITEVNQAVSLAFSIASLIFPNAVGIVVVVFSSFSNWLKINT